MKFHLTAISGNSKTGAIPVSTTSADSCPNSCPLKGNGCYAASGKVAIHWNKINNGERGTDFKTFLSKVKELPKRTLFRLNQAGDLAGFNDTIDFSMLKELIVASKHLRTFTYTHYDVLNNKENFDAVKYANEKGLVVNLSGNNVNHADELMSLGIGPVVTILSENAPKVSYTPSGNKVVVCPAQTVDKMTCQRCELCQVKDRSYIIGFRAHGNGKKKVEKML